MFAVETPEGTKYMVQLVGPNSYRMNSQVTYKGGTLTVTKKTRDYLVRKTNGAWADFDPTPEVEVEEILPPQFGEPGGPSIDMSDIDPDTNPALSVDQAMALAKAKGLEDVGASGGIDPADLNVTPTKPAKSTAGQGDITGDDLPGRTPKGGKPAAKKPAPKAAPTEGPTKVGAVTVE